MDYVLLSGFLIHCLNQPVVRSSQPLSPELQANERTFTWLYLQGEVRKRSEECWGTFGVQSERSLQHKPT